MGLIMMTPLMKDPTRAGRHWFFLMMLLLLPLAAPVFAATSDEEKTGDQNPAQQQYDCSQLSAEARKDCVYRQLFRVQNQQIQALAQRLEALTPEEADAVSTEEADAQAQAHIQTTEIAEKLTAQVHIEKESNRFWLTLAVACVGAIFLFVSLHHMSKAAQKSGARENAVRPSDIMNIVALHLIVFGTLLVVMTADVSDQLTAAAGILGALAGYIFRGINDRGDSVNASNGQGADPASGAHPNP